MNKDQFTGKLIVIVAPSGTGKSTMIKRLKKDYPTIVESVSFTTRPMRPGEIHGLSYFFISREEFIAKRDNNEFLEWAEVHGNFYGTSKAFVEQCLSEGKHVLFDLDVQGVDSMKLHFGDVANVIFIAPPSVEELEKRLRNRGTESTQIINLRITNAKKELLRKDDFDFFILNDDIENAYGRLKEITMEILRG
ncbi:guanylate kinase [Bacteriovorax stolpii]|uniref:Guanylate kinase n=1 Tax=Bacteriovorax stolpii TaxID=960 RepID=A0A2K9NVG4_BACTC|nr:guanylate kinase [Bacteriovorax stolpii]AUN99511.1 guanylate kinase [Bacteriovorax stolpii]QDK40496.1 guanylate kinase [Bacteriovorax stolpii]TDP51140.1 guanylate kinase [Bacteriovorax stolpii]BDT29685.1 guanylate kinase [Bacteriovorax sp. HI3]